jgi:tRNA-specific 2-thiouridylase
MKIIIGLSGGVDSSVAAHILLEQGFEVEALFMKNWEEDDKDGHCTAEQDLSDAKKVTQF